MYRGIEIVGMIVENPQDDIMDMGRLVRITAKGKQTKLTILAGTNVIGQLHLNAKETIIITKAASQSITCPDSYCT